MNETFSLSYNLKRWLINIFFKRIKYGCNCCEVFWQHFIWCELLFLNTTMNKLYSKDTKLIDLIAEQTKVRLRFVESNSTIIQTWFWKDLRFLQTDVIKALEWVKIKAYNHQFDVINDVINKFNKSLSSYKVQVRLNLKCS